MSFQFLDVSDIIEFYNLDLKFAEARELRNTAVDKVQ